MHRTMRILQVHGDWASIQCPTGGPLGAGWVGVLAGFHPDQVIGSFMLGNYYNGESNGKENGKQNGDPNIL